MDYLADRTRLIDASGIRKVFALAAQLKDPVNFSIGQPDFDVPDAIKEAAIEAIRRGNNRYSQTAGDAQVLARLNERMQARYGWQNAPAMLTSGVTGGLLLAFMALINPGDEVIIPEPYFVMYKHLVNMLGGKCVFVDTYPDFKLPADKIADAVTARTKVIVLNSPTNPTGVVNSADQIKQVVEIAKKHNLLIVSDEIYEDFAYAGPNASAASQYDKVLVLKGFSKTYAMTGWRLGYAVCHSSLAPLMEKMLMIQQYTFVCAPSPFQMSLVTALDYNMDAYIAHYRAKRDRMVEGLAKHYEVVKPEGAFYIFPKIPSHYPNASEFVKKAIANNLLVIPGNVFSERDTHFRISYATTDQKIEQGLDILKKLATERN
ncbi:MAG: aminotransferase class I/II-fold pyridoxal phosphate-dependent enzyme [Planctomycetaceae bacterium]|nr:aminotransferase class I/II-fold pyridoxal phosphate-dependent enzyme [Planctomycetaceae bacterium]